VQLLRSTSVAAVHPLPKNALFLQNFISAISAILSGKQFSSSYDAGSTVFSLVTGILLFFIVGKITLNQMERPALLAKRSNVSESS
jgi:hypothetical protein